GGGPRSAGGLRSSCPALPRCGPRRAPDRRRRARPLAARPGLGRRHQACPFAGAGRRLEPRPHRHRRRALPRHHGAHAGGGGRRRPAVRPRLTSCSLLPDLDLEPAAGIHGPAVHPLGVEDQDDRAVAATPITPPSPALSFSWITRSAACWSVRPPYSTSAEMSWATVCLMNSSPMPVAERAAVRLLA